jgi:tRNA pseudouridine38-40 synthase
MPRYFLEVAYKGTHYSGFQIQDNAGSVQAEIEKALLIFYRKKISLTGSSRTDAGVHALQNYFHFDFEEVIDPRKVYNINAILPRDIVIKGVYPVGEEAHCRFDAVSREYRYFIYRKKNPFLDDRAYFFPYTLNKSQLEEAAASIPKYTDFTSFSKRNTQVKTFVCAIRESRWFVENDMLVFQVAANRFLRGMVRGLVGTMLQVGRGKLTPAEFEDILRSRDNRHADFSVPGHGLFLFRVYFTDSLSRLLK